MCMYASSSSTRKFIEQNDIYVYKCFDSRSGALYSPYMETRVYINDAGEFVSNSNKHSPCVHKNVSVKEGIHVFLDEKSARSCRPGNVKLSVLRVKANLLDLIGVSRDGTRAVFSKIKFTKRQINKWFEKSKKQIW